MKALFIATCFALVSGCAFRDAKMFAADTQKALAPKNADITACYNGVLKTNPTAGGRVTVAYDIEEKSDSITNVVVDKPNTTAPDAVSECVTKNIAGVALTPPGGQVAQGKATYEFVPGKS